MSFFTDGDESKLKGKVRGKVLCQELRINPCFRLSGHCSEVSSRSGRHNSSSRGIEPKVYGVAGS